MGPTDTAPHRSARGPTRGRPRRAGIFAALVTLLLAAPVWAGGAAPLPAPGTRFRDAPWAPELVVVPPGRFLMGAGEEETRAEGKPEAHRPWERPIHPVVIPAAFAISVFDVTRADYKRFLAATRRSTAGGCMVDEGGVWAVDEKKSFFDPGWTVDDSYPATCVDHADAQAYAAWLSTVTGHHYGLPTEAQWEWAARAGTARPRWWGERRLGLCAYLNGADLSYSRVYPQEVRVDRSCDDGYVQTSPVGTFAPNPWGLYDMYGNVEQWTQDCFEDSYDGAPADGFEAVRRKDCQRFAVRGGTWHSDAPLFRAANRGFLPPTMRASSVGFRIVRLAD